MNSSPASRDDFPVVLTMHSDQMAIIGLQVVLVEIMRSPLAISSGHDFSSFSEFSA